MGHTTTKNLFCVCAVMLFVLIGCNSSSSTKSNDSKSSYLSSYPSSGKSNFQLNLTDAPRFDVASVIVNIKYVEIKAGKGSKTGDFIFANNFGQVDLLTLKDGVLLPMQDVQMPIGMFISQVRFILHEEGNYLVKTDGSICNLQTPSQQESGLKILVKSEATFESGYAYSLTVDFDAQKSIVFQGNGECLLTPVIKVGDFTRTEADDVNDDGSTDGDEDDLIDPVDPTPTPEPTPEVTPTPEPTPEVTPTPEATPEVTPTPEPTPEVTPTPEATPEVTPTPEATPEVTPTPEATPEVTPTPEATPEVTPTPEATPEVTPTPEATPEVTPTPEPTIDLTPDEDPICAGLVFDPNDPSTWPEDLTWEDLEPCI